MPLLTELSDLQRTNYNDVAPTALKFQQFREAISDIILQLRMDDKNLDCGGNPAEREPRRFGTQPTVRKAVSPLRSSLRCASPRQAATAVQNSAQAASGTSIPQRRNIPATLFCSAGW
jgi:hypothetical protein